MYKHWFVDFEFPFDFAQGKPDVEGKPYKSSGGAMVYNEELDKEIPEGWEVKRLENVAKKVCVGFVGSCYKYYCNKSEGIPMLRTTDLNEEGMSYENLKFITKEFHAKNKKSQLNKGDILVARHGTNGMPVIFDREFEANCLNTIIVKPNKNIAYSKLLHCFLKSDNVVEQIQSSLGGSVQMVLNTKIISNLNFLVKSEIIDLSSFYLNPIDQKISTVRKELSQLEKLQNLLLSKMATVGSEEELVTN